MKQTILTPAIIILALFTTIGLQAQVTIGSGQAPNKGALLDLKNQPDGSSTLGLGLPRVELSKLKPANPVELAASIGNTSDSYDLDEHIGLVVYNTKEPENCAVNPIYQGLYVFDGKQWQLLGQEKIKNSPDVHTMTDPRDNTVYRYRTFGAAGDWMLENLRYIPTDISFTHTADEATPRTLKHWAYPMSGTNTTPYNAIVAEANWHKPNGILYNWPAAINNENSTGADQGQTTTSAIPNVNEVEKIYESSLNARDGKIQGICPLGWHIPSDREWNQLEKEIYTNYTKYSQYTISDDFYPSTWDLSWETSTSASWRGSLVNGHGLAMLSECLLPGSIYGNPGGKSLSASQGGFEALYVGYLSKGRIYEYGRLGQYWSASSGPNTVFVWFRELGDTDKTRVYRFGHSPVFFRSVRCKKD